MDTRLIRCSRRPQVRTAGFSLAELMVVIVIIGLLATLVAPRALDALNRSMHQTAKIDIQTICAALDEYAIVNGGQFPESLEELVVPDENGHTFLNQMRVPLDPWGLEYQYEPPSGDQTRPRVSSLGKDGSVGGEGDARDLDNLTLLANGRR